MVFPTVIGLQYVPIDSFHLTERHLLSFSVCCDEGLVCTIFSDRESETLCLEQHAKMLIRSSKEIGLTEKELFMDGVASTHTFELSPQFSLP